MCTFRLFAVTVFNVFVALVPIWLAALLSFIIPFFFFCVFQIRRRSMYDLFVTTLGLIQALETAAVFQVFLKWLIGGFRPHFLEGGYLTSLVPILLITHVPSIRIVCKPNVQGPGAGSGFQQIYYTREVCTGDEKQINDSLESFPSGHSTAAFAGFVYLFLYFSKDHPPPLPQQTPRLIGNFCLDAQLKVNSDHRPAYWKIVLTIAPLLGATLIAGALTIDKCT